MEGLEAQRGAPSHYLSDQRQQPPLHQTKKQTKTSAAIYPYVGWLSIALALLL